MEDFEKDFYKHIMANFEDEIFSGYVTSATEPTTINENDWLDLINDLDKKYPKTLEGIMVTSYDILPTNTDAYQIETLDHKKYIAMHSDLWEKLLEEPGVVQESFGYPTIYGVPVRLNDPELFKIWMEIIERNEHKRTIS